MAPGHNMRGNQYFVFCIAGNGTGKPPAMQYTFAVGGGVPFFKKCILWWFVVAPLRLRAIIYCIYNLLMTYSESMSGNPIRL